MPWDASQWVNTQWTDLRKPTWRFPAAVIAGDQPYYSAEPQPEDLDVMAWYRPLAEPKRFAKRLTEDKQLAHTKSERPLYTASARGYVYC